MYLDYIHMHIHTYIHMHMHMYQHMHLHMYMDMHMHMHMHAKFNRRTFLPIVRPILEEGNLGLRTKLQNE